MSKEQVFVRIDYDKNGRNELKIKEDSNEENLTLTNGEDILKKFLPPESESLDLEYIENVDMKDKNIDSNATSLSLAESKKRASSHMTFQVNKSGKIEFKCKAGFYLSIGLALSTLSLCVKLFTLSNQFQACSIVTVYLSEDMDLIIVLQ